MKAVIFAGGVGSRLWPLSRENTPKQFEPIQDGKSTLQLAVDRLRSILNLEDIYISTNEKFRETLINQLPDLPQKNIIFEPARRDVGPAVGLAVANLYHEFPDEPIAILWGDHLIQSVEVYQNMLLSASEVIKENPELIVFLGQSPRYANPNIGWIEYGGIKLTTKNEAVHEFLSFKYKPDIELVRKYTKDGRHAWNMGYFVSTPRSLWGMFRKYAPELFLDLEKIEASLDTDEYDLVLHNVYPKMPKISFDHAVLEKLDPTRSLVISADIGWSDVGSWEALKESLEKSSEDNVTMGEVQIEGSQNSLVYENIAGKLVIGIDLDDLVIVDTADVLLVSKKSSASKVKKIVEALKEKGMDKFA